MFLVKIYMLFNLKDFDALIRIVIRIDAINISQVMFCIFQHAVLSTDFMLKLGFSSNPVWIICPRPLNRLSEWMRQQQFPSDLTRITSRSLVSFLVKFLNFFPLSFRAFMSSSGRDPLRLKWIIVMDPEHLDIETFNKYYFK